MGTLRRLSDGRLVTLSAVSVVGRSMRSDVQLEQGEVSGQHARIRWADGTWSLEDLKSRNGTYVDDSRLEVPEVARLSVGMRLAFGHVSNVWRVDSLDAPPLEAVPADGGRAVPAVNDVLLLALDDERLTVFGQGANWVGEDQDGGMVRLLDQEEVEVGGRRFRLHLPRDPKRSPAATMGTARFRVGARLEVEIAGTWHVLPAGPGLLRLARARATTGTGWAAALNEDVQASAQALSRLHVLGASHVLQRRRDGSVRFGGRKVEHAHAL